MDEPKKLHIVLNPAGVRAPAQRVVVIASQVVATALRALSKDDLSPASMSAEFLGYRFGGLEMTDEERRETYQNWILGKGFQDLARGVRDTLEEAVFYLGMIKMKPGRTTTGELAAAMEATRAHAAKLMFPELLEQVNAGLSEPMTFDAEFLSLQKVRNCLEHRGGRVGPRDVDPETGTMTLRFPGLRMFYRRGKEEVDVAVGEVIDTHDVDDSDSSIGEVPIYLKRVTRTREYALGEPVIISASDFAEIAFACHQFASDIASKLPTVIATEEAVAPEQVAPRSADKVCAN